MDGYRLVIPAGHGVALTQAVGAWGAAHAAHNPSDIRAIVAEHGPPALLVVSATMPNLTANVQALRTLLPAVPLLVAGTVLPASLRALAADDVVRFPFPPDYRPPTPDAPVGPDPPGTPDPAYAAARAWASATPDPPTGPNADRPTGRERVVLVTSAKGGDGKTTVAMQLAIWIAKQRVPVVVLDADYAGNAHEWLGVPAPAHTIAAFERDDRAWDRAALDGLLLQKSGVKVLPHARVVQPAMLERALRAFRPHYPVVIVDMHQGLTPHLIAAKEYATHLLVLTTGSERRLAATVQLLEELRKYDTPARALRLLVNRVRGEEDVRRVRAALADYRLPLWPLPYQEGLLVDDDPDFVPVSNAATRDPYPAAFWRMATQALDWEAPRRAPEDRSGRKRPSDPTGRSGPAPMGGGGSAPGGWWRKLWGGGASATGATGGSGHAVKRRKR